MLLITEDWIVILKPSPVSGKMQLHSSQKQGSNLNVTFIGTDSKRKVQKRRGCQGEKANTLKNSEEQQEIWTRKKKKEGERDQKYIISQYVYYLAARKNTECLPLCNAE